MWLLPVFSRLSSAATHVYYRFGVEGERVPPSGPVLLVANHPNSLLDPVAVSAVAGRPVRFLAKAPLCTDRVIGWLIRGAGAIPVYRRVDDPVQTAKNEDTFRAAFEELGRGACIGIFPEGISHSEPSMTDLKTGAARIALGTVARSGAPVQIVPVGLVFRRKDVFRSDAHAIIAPPVVWDDLRDRSEEDRAAVQELTERIAGALRQVTVNLEAWEDAPLVDCAEAIWTTEFGAERSQSQRIARVGRITAVLRDVRFQDDEDAKKLVDDVRTHCARLRLIGLRPHDLRVSRGVSPSLKWITRRIYLLGLPQLIASTVGGIAFWIPYRLTGRVALALGPHHDQISTYKLMTGIPIYGLWLVLIAIVLWRTAGPVTAVAITVSLPFVGLLGLLLRERWRGAWSDIRNFVLAKRRVRLIAALAERQHLLAQRLDEFHQAWTARPSS